jgi:hypothetical protein
LHKKEHTVTLENSKLIPENGEQMEHFTLLRIRTDYLPRELLHSPSIALLIVLSYRSLLTCLDCQTTPLKSAARPKLEVFPVSLKCPTR